MKKIVQAIGKIFVVVGIIFSLVHSFVFVSDGSATKDLFGFPIPLPPSWIGLIPCLGSIITFFYAWFSLHGLVGIVISALFLGVGVNLITFGKPK
jgi:hypothetical protein